MERNFAEPCKKVSNARARVVLPEQDGPAMAMSRGMPSALEPGGNGLAVERVQHVFGA